MKLRDYQIDILDLIDKNRFVIEFVSRQCGISVVNAIYFLHQAMFGKPKNIVCVANKSCSSKDLISKIKEIYKLMPFFLKIGVINWNEKQIVFENNSRIISYTARNLAIGFGIDIMYVEDMAKLPIEISKQIFNNILPTIRARKNDKFIIKSQPNGFNFFYDLVKNSELPEGHPEKNDFKTMRVYWWQVPGRDEKWKQDQIKMLGSEILFRQESELAFIGYNYLVEIIQ
jgi:hypothetical protein